MDGPFDVDDNEGVDDGMAVGVEIGIIPTKEPESDMPRRMRDKLDWTGGIAV